MLFSSFYGISTCSGNMELDISGFISISLVRDINRAVVGSIGRSGVLSWSWSVDSENDCGVQSEYRDGDGFDSSSGDSIGHGLLGKSGVRLGYRKLDQLEVLWDLDLLVDLLRARSEYCARLGLGLGGFSFGVRLGDCSNTNRHNSWIYYS